MNGEDSNYFEIKEEEEKLDFIQISNNPQERDEN